MPPNTRQSNGPATLLALAVFLTFTYLIFNSPRSKLTPPIIASAILRGDFNVTGELTLSQATPSSSIRINGTIRGLEPNSLRGFHIHSMGDLSDGCASTGTHFNPYGKKHGGPDDEERHAGDLGNIEADGDGVAHVDISDEMLQLSGPYTILARAIVVHTGTDDLGRGGHTDSSTTGHAGGRAACGIIGVSS